MMTDSPTARLIQRVTRRHRRMFPDHWVTFDDMAIFCNSCGKGIDSTTDGLHPEYVVFWSPDMKFTHDKGWDVTTPILVGSSQDLEVAARCAHPEYREILRASQDGISMIQEKCTSCVAVRIKTQPVPRGGQGTPP